MSQIPTTDDRLDSWKEIAAYLKRNQRTVIRWEKRGLPVYRVPGGKKQVVFAYRHELDAWLHQGGSVGISSQPFREEITSLGADGALMQITAPGQEFSSLSRPQPVETGRPAQNAVEPAIPKQTSIAPVITSIMALTPRTKWKLFVVALCVVGVAVTATALLFLRRQAGVHIVHFEKLTADGQPKSNLRSFGSYLYFNQFESGREVLASASVTDGRIRTINTPFSNVDLQDISNDGQRLLVTSFEGIVEKGERPLWVLRIKDGSPIRVGDASCDVARWSPDNRQIACVKGASIVIFDENGANVHTMGSFSSIPVRILWSPTGDKLRFVLWDVKAETQSAWELSISNKESTTITAASPLTLGKNCCWGWIWTYHSTIFLYARRDNAGHPGLFERPETGFLAQETELPVTLSDVGELAAGKSDSQFYVLMGAEYRGQLFKFDSRSNAFQTFLPGLSADCLSFSRDGKWMTYVSLPDKSLWRSRLDGKDAVQLTAMETEFSAWSPDSQQIAFMGKQPGKPWRVYLVSRDGGSVREAARGDDGQGAPTWSPDGTSLVYGNISCEQTHSCWIRRIDIASQSEDILPDSSGLRTARWSPDGKYILALQPQLHELMLFDLKTKRWKALVGSIMGDNPNWSTDSQYILVDNLRERTAVIEQVHVNDGRRKIVADLSSFQKSPGLLDYWIGLAPDNRPIVLHQFAPVDVYSVEWTKQ